MEYIGLMDDLMAKHILGNQTFIKFTINLLCSLLNLDKKEFIDAEITNSVKITKQRILDKDFETDIIVKTKEGKIYNLEVQNINSPTTEIKNTMYGMRIFSNQLEKGEEYNKTNSLTQIVIVNETEGLKKNKELIE